MPKSLQFDTLVAVPEVLVATSGFRRLLEAGTAFLSMARPETGRTGLRQNAVYVVRSDGYIGLASGEAQRFRDCGVSRYPQDHFTAMGLMGEPTAPVIAKGGPQKRNSYTLSFAQSSARSFR